jgi:hypothetical protein
VSTRATARVGADFDEIVQMSLRNHRHDIAFNQLEILVF